MAMATNPQLGIAEKCRTKYSKALTMCLKTPFVASLASGNLNLHTLRHYIAQDVYFLEAFAQAYELAEKCADDDDDAKIRIRELQMRILEQLKIHISFLQEWDIDPAKETNPDPTTVKYTEFLLAITSGKVEGVKSPGELATPEKIKVAAYILGAITPCTRIYALIGKELSAFHDIGGNSHPYKEWIVSYSSEYFQVTAIQTENLLDKLSVSLIGEEVDVIEKLYHQAIKLELDFFLAQPLVQDHSSAILTTPTSDQNLEFRMDLHQFVAMNYKNKSVWAEIGVDEPPILVSKQDLTLDGYATIIKENNAKATCDMNMFKVLLDYIILDLGYEGEEIYSELLRHFECKQIISCFVVLKRDCSLLALNPPPQTQAHSEDIDYSTLMILLAMLGTSNPAASESREDIKKRLQKKIKQFQENRRKKRQCLAFYF